MKMAINELTEARYYGKICVHHPEFKGLRLKRSYQCVQCNSENKAHASRGTMSATLTLGNKIDALRKEWDEHNTAMKRIEKQLEALVLEQDERGQ
ncbi:MAG: hypothetical protein WAV93_11410 [Bacteroidales bacterium]